MVSMLRSRGLFSSLTVLLCCVSTARGKRIKDQRDELERPGPAHVTRLHRYDHSGLTAMMEAEARWHAGPTDPAATKQRFLQLSKPQLEWLHKHHSHASAPLVQMGLNSSLIRSSLRSRQHLRHAEQANTSGEMPTTMLSSLDSQYVGPIGIGTVTVPQDCKAERLAYVPHALAGKSQSCHAEEQSEVWVVFDTGSTNLWVASDLCTSGGCADSDRVRYNHSLSQTYSDPEFAFDLHVQFGTGALDGPLGVDDLHVGPFTVYNQSFGLIAEAEGAVFESLPLEGILGLAFPAMAAKGASPFFDTIIKQRALPNNRFAFYFSLTNPSANAIFWGDVDEKFHTGPVEYFRVTDPFYWAVDLLSFQVGGRELLGDGSHAHAKAATSLIQEFSTPKAIIDTGTTFFTAGGDLYQNIMQALPSVACDKITETSHPPVLFKLKNEKDEVIDFQLTYDQYMAESGSSCSPAFMQIDIPGKHGPGMIFGEIFLRHYLAIFDRGDGRPESGRVGLVKSVHGSPVDERLKDLTHNQASFDRARRRL